MSDMTQDGTGSSLHPPALSLPPIDEQSDAPVSILDLEHNSEVQETAILEAATEPRVEIEKLSYHSGVVAKPTEESLRGYKQALKYEDDTRFSTEVYSFFDGIIVRECGVDKDGHPLHAAFTSGHAYHSDYTPLRRNLAILRNYLITHYLMEEVDEQVSLLIVQDMATQLGIALAGGRGKNPRTEAWWLTAKRLILDNNLSRKLTWNFIVSIIDQFRAGRDILSKPINEIFLLLANIPDRGIAYMYEYLLHFQESVGGGATGTPGNQAPRDWKILPLSETPFSAKNILHHSRSSRMGQIADAFEVVNKQMQSVDDLTMRSVDELKQPDKERSVKHARDILENMRIIMNMGEEQKVDVEDPHVHEAGLMLEVAVTYRNALGEVAKSDPNLINDPEFSQATAASEKIGYRVKVEERDMLKEEARPEAAKAADQRISKAPGKVKTKEPTALLLQKIDAGLNKFEKMDRKLPGRSKQNAMGTRDLGQHNAALKGVKEGLNSTMSGSKITQVSHPSMVSVAQRMNEAQPDGPHRDTPGSKGGPSK